MNFTNLPKKAKVEDIKKIDVSHKKTPKDEPKKKLNKTFLLFKISVMFVLLALSVYGAQAFYNSHDFRTPVIFQNPVPKKVIHLESPIGSKSAGMTNQVYAEEVKNPFDARSPKGVAWEINKDRFGIEHWGAFEELVANESGWNPYSVNGSSGACGLGQALPCSKMDCEKWDYECQVNWVADYIKNRYKNPTEALNFWNTKHLINGQMVNYY